VLGHRETPLRISNVKIFYLPVNIGYIYHDHVRHLGHLGHVPNVGRQHITAHV